MRDRYTCQYCHRVMASGELTLDHVVPRSRAGETAWENLVACCHPCNNRKGNRILGGCTASPVRISEPVRLRRLGDRGQPGGEPQPDHLRAHGAGHELHPAGGGNGVERRSVTAAHFLMFGPKLKAGPQEKRTVKRASVNKSLNR